MMMRMFPEDEKRINECEKWLVFNGECFVFREDTPKDIIDDYNRIYGKEEYAWFRSENFN